MAKIATRQIDGLSSVLYAPVFGSAATSGDMLTNMIETKLSAGWKCYGSGEGAGGTFVRTPQSPLVRNGSGTFKTGTGDSIALVSGTTWSLTDAGASFDANDVGRFVRIAGAANAGNNGFFLVTALVSATQIRITNAAGVAETSSFTWAFGSAANNNWWAVLGEPALRSGTGDSIALVSGSTFSLTDAGASFDAADVGKQITIWGASNAANNGSFTITARPSATVIQYTNAAGVAETSSLSWDIHRREWLYHRTTSDQFRVYYSALDHFSGTGFGAVSSTVPPSATDAVQKVGSANGFASLTPGVSSVCHCIADDAPEGEGYFFFTGFTSKIDGDPQYWIGQDPLLVGSYPANTATSAAPNGDEDPMLVYATTNVGIDNTSIASPGGIGSGVSAWYKYNQAGETHVVYSGGQLDAQGGSGRMFPGNSATTGPGPDPYNGKFPFLPITFARTATTYPTQGGMKGVAKNLAWKPFNTNFPSNFDLSSDARVIVDELALPWPNGVVPRWR